MIRVMENPVLVITESRDQGVDHQLAKSIGSGSIVQQSRGTPIIDELWHGTIAPSELEKGARYKEYGGHTAGEGSRGGHVIGHTKSGKPVYRGTINQKDGKTFPAGHEEYSKQDHLDAAEAHQKVPMIQPEDYSDNGNVLHQDLARKHREMANGEKPKHYSPPEGSTFAGKSLRVNDAINSLTSIFKAEEIEDEDEEPEEKFKKKDDEKETEKSELSFYIDLVKAEDGEKDDSQMTDAEAEGAADREANKDDSEDEDEEKSLSDVLNDLIKAGKQGEGSRGGKIIGHTRSGKPIYSNGNNPAHKNFTVADHYDAIRAHGQRKADVRDSASRSHGTTESGDGPDKQSSPNLQPSHEAEMDESSASGKFHAKQMEKKGTTEDYYYQFGKEKAKSPASEAPAYQGTPRQQRNEASARAANPRIGTDQDLSRSLPEGNLSKGTPMGVPEIKVDQYGIPLYEGNAFEVHDDADKNTVRELINAGLVGDPEHAMDKRIPQVINRVLGGVY